MGVRRRRFGALCRAAPTRQISRAVSVGRDAGRSTNASLSGVVADRRALSLLSEQTLVNQDRAVVVRLFPSQLSVDFRRTNTGVSSHDRQDFGQKLIPRLRGPCHGRNLLGRFARRPRPAHLSAELLRCSARRRRPATSMRIRFWTRILRKIPTDVET